MKKLLLVIITGLSLFIGASFADFTSYSVTPADQVAISGSLVGRNIHITNSTGDAYVKVMLPLTQTEGIAYQNASQLPINNSLLQLGVGNEPIFFVASGATLNLVVTGKVVTSSRGFTQMGVKFPASNDSGFAGMFTSAIATISPIADLAISKILTGALPIFSGDLVHYLVTIQNIGSTFATGIQLADSFPIPLFGLPSAIVNGNPLAYNTPITLPNIFVRDLGGAYILAPGQAVTFHISAALMQQVVAGTAFANTAQANTASSELTTGNNKVTVTGTTVAPADLYIHKTMLPFTGFAAGSTVVYILTYGNSGGSAISGVVINDTLPAVVSATPTMRVAGALQPGQTGQIIVTGTLNTTLTGGTTFVNIATIGGNGVEQTTGNNSSIVTGTIASLPNITLDIQANNLTRPQYDTTQYGASGPNSMILAVSGDLVQLTINYGNIGNTAATNASISLAGLGGFISYGALNGTLGNLNIGQTGTIVITGIVGPQNYISFTPTATLTYNSTQTVSDTVKIQEPFVCGDGLITRTEPCDTAGQIGLTISGQVCENHGGFCVAVTKDIVNTACLDYRFTLGSGRICSSVQFPIAEDVGQCKDLIVHGSSIILADESNGHYRGTASFTCDAQNGVASTIAIDCGNGEIHTGTNISSFNATCTYNETSIPTNRTVQCYVDGTTQSDCQQKMIVDKAEFGRCGDGIIQGYEQCDEEGMEEDETINGCRNCHLVDDEEIPPMACFSLGNTNVSIQENEILPFRWKVDLMGSKLTDECGDENDNGKIVRDSMKCEFRIFNGDKPESGKGASLSDYNAPTVKTFTKDCDVDERVDDNGKLYDLFKYFDDQKGSNYTLLKHSGRYALDFSDVDIRDDNNNNIYGEYNIALYKVKYNYCEGGEEKKGTPIDRVCESDFTVTKPYLAQKSSFGLTPTSTDINLDGYQSIIGESIIKKTDLDKIMVIDADTYKGGSNVNSLMTSFIRKYDKLAVVVDKNRIAAFKGNDDITSVKIVPQQKIYIIQGKANTTLTLNAGDFSDTPFTLVTRNINLVVQGDMQANGMFLVDKGTISFQEPVAKRCAATQKVQGIFITNSGFAADPEDLSNNDTSKDRCNQGGLHVKGVLIGNNVADLVASRRSQLNHWFYGTDSDIERRNEIFNGAAVLIEYSPSLRTALPPGASEFTKALDVYKK